MSPANIADLKYVRPVNEAELNSDPCSKNECNEFYIQVIDIPVIILLLIMSSLSTTQDSF